jgi:hypothetical protein
VAVTERIDELILGVPFLTQHNCCWNFGDNTIIIDGHQIRLYGKPRGNKVRRMTMHYILSATLTVPAFMKNVFLNLDLNFCYCCLVLTKLYTMLDVCFELLRDQQPKKARTETEMISELKSELKRLKSCNCKLN